ncbi:hypothetical protein KR093_002359 [Drosophila rubida]|uniref:Citrate transporter-like domain-containing protein n=1 Tax=Drosophila rubida TaxID=30044 RepID=A0AAD4K3U8_9MUSC|nr:hypothetical protein KR093_002359 [Drosophila rubida]
MAAAKIFDILLEHEQFSNERLRRRAICKRILVLLKIAVFLAAWAFFTLFIVLKAPETTNERLISLQPNKSYSVNMDVDPSGRFVCLKLKGNIDVIRTQNAQGNHASDTHVDVTLESFTVGSNKTLWKSSVWSVYMVDAAPYSTNTVKKMINVVDWNKNQSAEKSQRAGDGDGDGDVDMKVSLINMSNKPAGVSLMIVPDPVDPRLGTWLGCLLLVFLYALIAFEIADRAFAAILVSITALGMLSMMDLRPSFPHIISWIDIDTLMLLFGMMVMVAILSDTGLFDVLSLFAYRLSNGKIWLLLFYLYMFTGLLSALLDNVTMVLMIVPVTVRLCEAVGLHTTLVVINIVIFSNVGGALTPVGDPPNMIIATNKDVIASGVNFGNFTLHMFPGVIVSMMIVFGIMYFITRNKIYTGRASQLRHSIEELEKLLRNMKDKQRESAMRRLSDLRERLKGHENNTTSANKDFDSNLNDMKRKYRIRDKVLLVKCIVAFTFAVSMFLLHSVPSMHGISLAWAAVLAAILLLILADLPDLDKVLSRVEWDTLIFFAALFILTEALVEIGLIDTVSNLVIDYVVSVDKGSQLLVSIMLVLWISAIGAAFIGNIPITTMMLKITIRLGNNERLNLPMQPLVWAMAFGACFGGNGTLIGASANVVSAGIANQYGHQIDFKSFFIIGFPIMLLTVVIAGIYLVIVHCLFTWH